MLKFILTFTLITGLLVVFSVEKASSASEGPLGYWPFDDGSGDIAKDQSGNGHDAKIVGAKWIKNGKFKMALDFDGKSHVDIPQSDALSKWEALTFMAWVYPNSFQGDWERIIDCDLRSSGFWTCCRQDGTFDWGFRPQGVQPVVEFTANGKAEQETWTHVAFVWELKGALKGGLRAYINGEMDAKTATFAAAVTTPGPFRIGGCSGQAVNAIEWWLGYIDEVVIYDRVLEANEIKESIEGRIPGAAAIQSEGKLATNWGKIKSI
jgi:hypothetical protein